MPKWTPTLDAELTKLWNEGYSAKLISLKMGLATRNMIVGRVRRLGLKNKEVVFQIRFGHTIKRKLFGPKKPKVPKPQMIRGPKHLGHRYVIVSAKKLEPTKSDLRRMLAEAVRNTAAMPVT